MDSVDLHSPDWMARNTPVAGSIPLLSLTHKKCDNVLRRFLRDWLRHNERFERQVIDDEVIYVIYRDDAIIGKFRIGYPYGKPFLGLTTHLVVHERAIDQFGRPGRTAENWPDEVRESANRMLYVTFEAIRTLQEQAKLPDPRRFEFVTCSLDFAGLDFVPPMSNPQAVKLFASEVTATQLASDVPNDNGAGDWRAWPTVAEHPMSGSILQSPNTGERVVVAKVPPPDAPTKDSTKLPPAKARAAIIEAVKKTETQAYGLTPKWKDILDKLTSYDWSEDGYKPIVSVPTLRGYVRAMLADGETLRKIQDEGVEDTFKSLAGRSRKSRKFL